MYGGLTASHRMLLTSRKFHKTIVCLPVVTLTSGLASAHSQMASSAYFFAAAYVAETFSGEAFSLVTGFQSGETDIDISPMSTSCKSHTDVRLGKIHRLPLGLQLQKQ